MSSGSEQQATGPDMDSRSYSNFWFSCLKDKAHFSDQILEMAVTSLIYEDWLEGASNFLPWKARIMFFLKENGLWSHANTIVIASTYPAKLAKHEAKEAKAMSMILDLARDLLVSHLSEKKLVNAMFSTLTNLFRVMKRTGRWY